MRQVGTLDNQQDAHRFASYLVTQGISARPEEDSERWSIWVLEESQVGAAREAFEEFQQDPGHERYRNLEGKARSIVQGEERRREAVRRNVIEMRGRWPSGAAGVRRPAPFVSAVITLCVVVAMFSGVFSLRYGSSPGAEQVKRRLMFVDQDLASTSPFASVARGEVWRLVTPAFLHLNLLHLAFNMFALLAFGRALEHALGAPRLALMMLVIAIVSNVAQAATPPSLQATWGGPFFGGMSGVVYGLFGYSWMAGLRGAKGLAPLSPGTVMMMLVWLGLGLAGMMHIANTCHVTGLLTGMVAGAYATSRT